MGVKIERVSGGLPGTFGSFSELENEPPVSWLIKDWLAAREITVIYGQGGTFKSYVALGWSLQLAVVRRVPTLYVAAEGVTGLRSRVAAWLAAHHVKPHMEEKAPWNYYNAGVHLDDVDSRRMWVQGATNHCKKKPPRLVVVDTLARNFAGDESSPKDMGMFIEGCEYMRRELDTAVLVVHHMGVKGDRERGTGALRNASFCMIKTGNARYNDRGGGSVELDCNRMKDAPMPDDVREQFDTVSLDVNEHGDVMQLSQAMREFPPKGKQKPRKTVIKSDS
jgi:hypothetical protein